VKFLQPLAWLEYKTPEGRTYYYNTKSKETRWERPAEFKPSVEQAARSTQAETAVNSTSASTTAAEETAKRELTPKSSAIDTAIKATLADIELPGEVTSMMSASRLTSTHVESSDDDTHSNDSNSMDALTPSKQLASSTLGSVVASTMDAIGKKQAMDAFKDLLREKGVTSSATWENALRLIGSDPRFAALRALNEKKQVFNAYKVQRQKEEKEEERKRLKQSKEELEKFLQTCEHMNAAIKYT
jgi:pre-mRNA-processing factor 40